MLKHDSPNMFSTAFLTLTGFVEASSRRLVIVDKSPDLFYFILDYLRGYTIFPLDESAVLARWLPLTKLYENLRRDASYYGLLGLEAECSRWVKRSNNDSHRLAVLKMDFGPFSHPSCVPHPLCSEILFECHLSDVQFLRKRFLKAGLKTLTYGPVPWKQIFDQVRAGSIQDGTIQIDGSSIFDAPSMFLKPPRSAEDEMDPRKVENAKIHISKAITNFILNRVRPAGMNSFVTLRFHVTEATLCLAFPLEQHSLSNFSFRQGSSSPIGTADLIFTDKQQKEGYNTLHSIIAPESMMEYVEGQRWNIPLDSESGPSLQVDSLEINWSTLCQWAKSPELAFTRADLAPCERLFGSRKPFPDSKTPRVRPLTRGSADAGIYFRVGGVYCCAVPV
jgi:hypothetical protein